jgi:hypothetical protein
MSLIRIYLFAKTIIFRNERIQLVFKMKTTGIKIRALDPDPDSEYGSGFTDQIESGSNPDPTPCSLGYVLLIAANQEFNNKIG